jgi:hypothetical protein
METLDGMVLGWVDWMREKEMIMEDSDQVLEGYVQKALRTESCDFDKIRERLDRPTINRLRLAIYHLIKVTDELDIMKKYIFYGKVKEAPLRDPQVEMHTIDGTSGLISPQSTIRLLHAILGLATESGELFEQWFNHVFKGQDLNPDKVISDIGDSNFYERLACNVMKILYGEMIRRNVRELEARYPEKFTEERALVRDEKNRRCEPLPKSIPATISPEIEL